MTEPIKIPKELFSQQNLEELRLTRNFDKYGFLSQGTHHLPPEIAQLLTLKKLWLSSTHLRGLPKELAALKKLEELDLSDNWDILEFPLVITELENLRVLRLNNTGISVLPREIMRLTNLQLLDLTNTCIREIHDDIIPFLKRIKLEGGIDLDIRQADPSTFTGDRMVQAYQEWRDTSGKAEENLWFMVENSTRLETITGAHLAQLDFGFHFFKGDGMLEKMTRPETIDISFIVEQQNIRTRLKLINKIGIERFVRESGAIKYHEDESGILWRRVMRQIIEGEMGAAYAYETDEVWQAVEIKNTTPEPDGSRRTRYLAVPPNIKAVYLKTQPDIETVPEALARIAEMKARYGEMI